MTTTEFIKLKNLDNAIFYDMNNTHKPKVDINELFEQFLIFTNKEEYIRKTALNIYKKTGNTDELENWLKAEKIINNRLKHSIYIN